MADPRREAEKTHPSPTAVVPTAIPDTADTDSQRSPNLANPSQWPAEVGAPASQHHRIGRQELSENETGRSTQGTMRWLRHGQPGALVRLRVSFLGTYLELASVRALA